MDLIEKGQVLCDALHGLIAIVRSEKVVQNMPNVTFIYLLGTNFILRDHISQFLANNWQFLACGSLQFKYLLSESCSRSVFEL